MYDNRETESLIVEIETLSEMKLILDYMMDFYNIEIISVIDRDNTSLILYKWEIYKQIKVLEDDIKNKKYLKTYSETREE